MRRRSYITLVITREETNDGVSNQSHHCVGFGQSACSRRFVVLGGSSSGTLKGISVPPPYTLVRSTFGFSPSCSSFTAFSVIRFAASNPPSSPPFFIPSRS